MEDLKLELAQMGHGDVGPRAQQHTGQMIDLDDDYYELASEHHGQNYPDMHYTEQYHNGIYPAARNAHGWAYAEDVDMLDAAP